MFSIFQTKPKSALKASKGSAETFIGPKGQPLLKLGQGEFAKEVNYFLSQHGHKPGCRIVGEGRSHTVITVPMYFRGAFPEVENVSVVTEGSIDIPTRNGLKKAAVVFENPVTVTTRNLSIYSKNPFAFSMAQIATDDGFPEPDWKDDWGTWPDRYDNEAKLWRDSKSEHYALELYSQGGGGLYAGNLVTPDTIAMWQAKSDSNSTGNFTNHIRLIGGHQHTKASWGDIKAFHGLGNSNGWEERYSGLPAIELDGHKMECHHFHADVFPHAGLIANGEAKIEWDCAGSYLEPIIKDGKAREWGAGDVSGWIIGGDAVGHPQWGDDVSRSVRAGTFTGKLPAFMHGENHWFEPTAVW